LGTIRKLAALICFGFERERWLLATLHLAWERKELNQWLASSGRKKDQRKGSSTVKDVQRTGKRGKLSGSGLVRLRAGDDWLPGSGEAERCRWLGCQGRHALSRTYVWANVHLGSVRCSRVQAKGNPSAASWNVRTGCFEIRGAMRWFCSCTHVRDCAWAKMAPCPSCA
jgi:hypothetical protein